MGYDILSMTRQWLRLRIAEVLFRLFSPDSLQKVTEKLQKNDSGSESLQFVHNSRLRFLYNSRVIQGKGGFA